MKELELLMILNNVRSEYILQAQELRSGNAKKVIRKVSRKRVFLIAAVIALLLLLAGCAAVLIGIQKINLGHVIFSNVLWQNGAPYERDVLSLSSYDAYFENWMPGSVASEAYSPDYQQKFLDLDGDGDDEMLIWNVRTGVVYEVVTRVDGSTVCIYGGGQYGLDDHTAELYQCEGNILERQFTNGASPQGRQLHEYYRIQDRQMVMVECVSCGNDGKWYWSESGGASSVMWREITEEEYDAVLAKYTRVQGETWEDQPLSGSAKAALKKEADERLLLCLKDQYAFYRPEDGMEYTLADYCRKESAELGFPVSITRYTFVDMDGDGVQEAVVDFRFGENEQVMCMVLRYDCGSLYAAEFYHRQMSQIKEDGTFAYSGGGDNDGWARLRWENMEWVTEKVGSIYYGDSLKDVTWYPYPVNSDMNGDG